MVKTMEKLEATHAQFACWRNNEITAIPALLNTLEISGYIITIDAIGIQTKIARLIIEAEADYILAVKENQGELYQDLPLKNWISFATWRLTYSNRRKRRRGVSKPSGFNALGAKFTYSRPWLVHKMQSP